MRMNSTSCIRIILFCFKLNIKLGHFLKAALTNLVPAPMMRFCLLITAGPEKILTIIGYYGACWEHFFLLEIVVAVKLLSKPYRGFYPL
jgi:hypothetical protein